eukprot:CAMPEP_0113320746 /NCGR_PEP_ID=MMETSP0010_2-20120614/14460_1 /TAXON_ID=216773 ORGANISM="Corethron hystrix, Strain 308" /NCGR_SAMPLE_ID=MMETSP0010_2 /ASSEMBLY_ACC=CAM_ASM_000155 /LENGTH=213 /DNA_ID=CAMNT_0000178647 /DNA_START=735 /DNA_END=1376 /DNA_ORIENTATION=- /assembly_acc=CAM_ASM_000155
MTPWCVYLPPCAFVEKDKVTHQKPASTGHELGKNEKYSSLKQFVCIGGLIAGSFWFELFSDDCNQSVRHIWSNLLHNRWNVFVGAEEYVTWEIAPGRLNDGTVIDIWSKKSVTWDMPVTGSPSTSTARGGRWRSFPYLAGLDGEDGEALWNYLCWEWNTENRNPLKKLVRFNFFMLQADVLPNMQFSPTRKRLIHSQECTPDVGNITEERDEL